MWAEHYKRLSSNILFLNDFNRFVEKSKKIEKKLKFFLDRADNNSVGSK